MAVQALAAIGTANENHDEELGSPVARGWRAPPGSGSLSLPLECRSLALSLPVGQPALEGEDR